MYCINFSIKLWAYSIALHPLIKFDCVIIRRLATRANIRLTTRTA